MRLHLLLLGLLVASKAHAAPVFSDLRWDISTGYSPSRDSFVASWPAGFTVVADFEHALHPAITTPNQIDTDPWVGFCCTAGGAGHNTTPGGLNYLFAYASTQVPGVIELNFLIPIDSLALFATGLRDEFQHTLRVFDGQWYEYGLSYYEDGVGFVAPGSRVTAVQLVSRVSPDYAQFTDLGDHFAIDDVYVHFTSPEPATFPLILAAAAGFLVRQFLSRPHRG